jgi:hypothetical protein
MKIKMSFEEGDTTYEAFKLLLQLRLPEVYGMQVFVSGKTFV